MKTEFAVDATDNNHRSTRILTLLEKLRRKTRNFSVIARDGQLLGETVDLILDRKRQLNFLVSPEIKEKSSDYKNKLFILASNLIDKIDVGNQSILANIGKSELKSMPEYLDNETIIPKENSEASDVFADGHSERIAEEEIIKLLGERLIVERSKRKVGEVIVRKEIETRMVQVPVRYEKLIVEQVTPERKQLAEIDLGQGEISGIELGEAETSYLDGFKASGFESGMTVSGEFHSAKIASLLLNAIALEQNHGFHKVQVTIFVDDEEQQQKYQQWFDRCSKS